MTDDTEAADDPATDVDAEDEDATPAEETDAEPEAAEDAAAADDAEDGLDYGDFVRLAYTARTVEGGTLVDTTDPEVAEEEGVDQEGQEFSPRIIVIGEGHIFDVVEQELVGAQVGDSGTVTVSAAEAFGEYDEESVRTISAEKIPEDDRHPGAHVTIDGEQGHVNTIIGGRARVDFNHPLAGEDIEYDYEILGVVEDKLERAEGLFSMFLDVSPEMWIQTDEIEEEVQVEPEEGGEEAEPEFETQTVEKESLYVESTPQLSMNQQWMFGKQQIAQQIMNQLEIDRVVVQEIIDGMGGMGMPGMMGGMGGGAGAPGGDVEDALEDADVDAEDIVEELEDE